MATSSLSRGGTAKHNGGELECRRAQTWLADGQEYEPHFQNISIYYFIFEK
jgi:hypothetical protein